MQVAECKSGTHNNGGVNPDWNGRKNFFTFYVPSTVPLTQLAVVLEVYDDNMGTDKMIGTCGKIPLQGVRQGKRRRKFKEREGVRRDRTMGGHRERGRGGWAVGYDIGW